jgi:hypothetical protein
MNLSEPLEPLFYQQKSRAQRATECKMQRGKNDMFSLCNVCTSLSLLFLLVKERFKRFREVQSR